MLKKITSSLIVSTFLFSSVLISQTNDFALNLRNGSVVLPEGNFENTLNAAESELIDGKFYRLIQFYNVPDQFTKNQLMESGVQLLDYLDNKTYFSAITVGFDMSVLKRSNVRSISKINANVKLHPQLFHKNFPQWAESGANKLKVNTVLFNTVDFQMALEWIEDNLRGIEVLNVNANTSRLRLEINKSQLSNLSEVPFVMFIEPIDQPGEPENYTGRTLHRSNTIAGDALTSRKYDGTGINVGMHDDGVIGPHIDYQGRIAATYVNSNSGDHGDHVAGTIMGAGNLNPQNKGMAFGANLYVYGSSNNNYDSVPAHYNNESVIITSKSYSNGCNAGYTNLSRELDGYVRQMPSLMHVFSAGNDGNSDCGYGAGAGWGNITGGHKAGKNVITVANLDETDGLAGSSSRGPAEDGRIKPDISAKGTGVVSTSNPNTYVTKTGTSMSCPGISGSLAQLYHAYKELNSGVNPPSALMKATMLNTADDIGNVGPDFKHGWGRVNNLRAVEVLENNQYFSGTLNQNDSSTHDITVPANVSQLKVMVYWNDYEASTSAATALVNNIDFKLSDPSATSFNPWVLDPSPSPSALNSLATRGIDNLNNMEQVTIDNPAAGIYTATVLGKLIPQGPQDYYLVYSFVMEDITVTYPNGGEALNPNSTELIRWDAGDLTGNFNIEYSDNSGSSWNTITTVSSNLRHYNWTVPNTTTGEFLIRVSNGALSDASDTTFSVIRVPSGLDIDWICPDSLQLSWNGVSAANAYEVSKLGVKYMDSATTSAVTSAVLRGIQPNMIDWFSVKALGPNGAVGRRAIAIEKPLGTFSCPIPDDASLSAILSPLVSLPDCKDNSSVEITVEIKNEGLNSISNVPVNFRLNSGSVVSEVYSGTIASKSTFEYTFTTTADLSSIGTYEIQAWTTLGADQNSFNDTVILTVASFQSELVSLPWSEDFESFFQCGTFNNCEGTTCGLRNGWHNHENLTIDDTDWRTDDDGTNTPNTGPTIDHNPGTSNGNYLYTEVSGDCFNKEAFLITPCIDLSGARRPELTFWHHMFGSDIGSLNIDILINGKWDLGKIQYTTTRGDIWRESKLNLAAYAGDTINIRFRAISANGPFGDIAIDDVSIIETDSAIGIGEITALSSVFNIYPNPAGNELYLTYGKEVLHEDVSVNITDVQGRAIKDFKFKLDDSTMEQKIDLSKLKKGMYIIRVYSSQGQYTKRFILQ